MRIHLHMHLDLVESLPNSFKMIAENVNTHAHGDVYLVVLAHLGKRWSFSEFVEVKCPFSVDRMRWSNQPDARVTSDQFKPRAKL
jgi:hypothetical protein